MIEIEKKFNLTKEQEENLKKDAAFISKKEMVDSYFDNEKFDLTKNDVWLRERNGQFELKVCQDKNIERKADQYDELEDEDKIREFLKIKKQGSFIEDIKKAGYLPFCELKTIRSKYKSDSLMIDIDEVRSDGYFYALVEIEMMVENQSQTKDAADKIVEFAKSKGLETGVYTRGKVLEYIRQKRPEHFKVLVEAKVVK